MTSNEVFKFDWLVVFKTLSDQKYTIIHNNRNELEEFYNKNKNNLFVGYNNKHYDDLILKGILSKADPYVISKLILSGESQYRIMKALKIENININSFDLMQDIKGLSLKEVEAYLEMSIEESDVGFEIDRQLTQ